VVSPPEDHRTIPGEVNQSRMESIQENQRYRDKLMHGVGCCPNLPGSDKTLLYKFLMDQNDVRVTDMIQN